MFPLQTQIQNEAIEQIRTEGTAQVQEAVGFAFAFVLPVLSVFAVVAILRALFVYLSD